MGHREGAVHQDAKKEDRLQSGVLGEDVEWVSKQSRCWGGDNMPGQGETMYSLVPFLWGVSLFGCFGPESAPRPGGQWWPAP